MVFLNPALFFQILILCVHVNPEVQLYSDATTLYIYNFCYNLFILDLRISYAALPPTLCQILYLLHSYLILP